MPLEEVPQQSIASIDEEINHLRRRLEVDFKKKNEEQVAAEEEQVAAEKAHAAAEKAWVLASARVSASMAATAHALTKLEKYNAFVASMAETTPEIAETPEMVVVSGSAISDAILGVSIKPVSARPAAVLKAPAAKAGRDGVGDKAPDLGATPIARPRLTVPERMAVVMGSGVWTAARLEQALIDAGEEIHSNKPRSYLASTLGTTMMRVDGPDGDLRDRDGSPLKVHRFTVVERGKYRVATPEDIQREVRKILGTSEVIISENAPRTPADELFAEQGIDIGPALVAAQH